MTIAAKQHSPYRYTGVIVPKTFGQMVLDLRTRKGWTGERLAEEADIAQGSVSKYENGERKPKRSTVEKIAAAFGVPSDDLLLAAGFTVEAQEMKYIVYLDDLTPEGYSDYDDLPPQAHDLAKADATEAAKAEYERSLKRYKTITEAIREVRRESPGTVVGPVEDEK